MIDRIKSLFLLNDESSSKSFFTSGQTETRRYLDTLTESQLISLNDNLISNIRDLDARFVLNLLMVFTQIKGDKFRGFAWLIFNEAESIWGKNVVMQAKTILENIGDLPSIQYEVPKYRLKVGATIFEPISMSIILSGIEIKLSKHEFIVLYCLATKSMGEKVHFSECNNLLLNSHHDKSDFRVIKSLLLDLSNRYAILNEYVIVDEDKFIWK